MSHLVEYTLHCEALPLVDVARAVPAATLTVDVGGPNASDPPPFTVTVEAPDLEAVEATLADSSFVADLVPLAGAADSRRYRVEPTRTMAEQLGDAVDDLERLEALAGLGTLEYAKVVADGWRQRRRFADSEAFEAYWSFWRAEAGLTIHRLVESPAGDSGADGPQDPWESLSGPQREALATAFELGYFAVPRNATLAEVADALGVAPSACSERLRRGQRALVAATMAASETGASG